MRKYGKLVIGIIVLALLLGGSAFLYKGLAEKYRPDALKQIDKEKDLPETGQQGAEDSTKAPDFAVVNEAEEEVKLSDFVGKPVVLNFWASWCGPCKSEMPFFQNMYDAYGEEVVFMMVNLTDGSRETVETALDYVQQAEYTFPVYFDTNQEAAYAYYVNSIPATYFIDAEGNLAAYGVGSLQEENILQGLNMLGIATE